MEARRYHQATKHSWASVREDRHVLDWETKPFPFKVYPDAAVVALPRDVAGPTLSTLTALERVSAPPGRGRLGLDALAQLLFFSAGVTRKKVYPGGEAIHFRAAATTGALYEVEVYVVASAVAALDPGVYHFCPGDFALRRLRGGDFRLALADAAGQEAAVREGPATLVLSAIYWRNTWKYRARAYRHFFWDAGTLLANVLAVAVAADLPARVLLGFADQSVNDLLGLDPRREASLVLVPVGRTEAVPAPSPAVAPLALATVPLSPREVDYPLVRQAHLASVLGDGDAARAWRGLDARHPFCGPPSGLRGEREDRTLGETILRRGSTRQFAHEPIALVDLTAILAAAIRPLPLDASDAAVPLVETYLLVHAVRGLASGTYHYDPASRGVRPLRLGEFRAEGGRLCLGQALGADASVVAFFLADLDPIFARYGDRGYRAVNLAAGLLGGRCYLAAYGLGLGASGLTFYDDDVVRFFSPDATGKDAIFVTALGRPRSPGPSSGLRQAAGVLRPVRPGDP